MLVAASPLPVAAEQRIESARHLAQTGDGEQALRELLWSLDHGLAALDRNRRASQLRRLAQALVTLGQRYPIALTVARERWTNLRAKLLHAGDIDNALNEFVAFSQALGERDAVLALYDQLPPTHQLRTFVGIRAFSDLVRERRYRDALMARDYATMSSNSEGCVAPAPQHDPG